MSSLFGSQTTLYTAGIDYSLGEESGQRLGERVSNQVGELTLLNFFLKRAEFDFRQLEIKDNCLIAQGTYTYQGETYLIGKTYLIFRNKDNEYIIEGAPGFNGNFYLQIDLSLMEPGEYAIYAGGAVIEGKDANGDRKLFYQPTDYKITVE